MDSKKYRALASRWWKREIRPLLILALILFSIRSSLADWNSVPTGSMQPTILVGDRVLVNKLAYDLKVPFTTWHIAEWSNPQRGDIVVFFSPKDGTRMVKRVIGLPGDTLAMEGFKMSMQDMQQELGIQKSEIETEADNQIEWGGHIALGLLSGPVGAFKATLGDPERLARSTATIMVSPHMFGARGGLGALLQYPKQPPQAGPLPCPCATRPRPAAAVRPPCASRRRA